MSLHIELPTGGRRWLLAWAKVEGREAAPAWAKVQAREAATGNVVLALVLLDPVFPRLDLPALCLELPTGGRSVAYGGGAVVWWWLQWLKMCRLDLQHCESSVYCV